MLNKLLIYFNIRKSIKYPTPIWERLKEGESYTVTISDNIIEEYNIIQEIINHPDYII